MKLKRKTIGLTLATLGVALFVSTSRDTNAGVTSTATATATATVKASIVLTKTRDLAFGVGTPSDAAKVVLASDAANSAVFSVAGEPSTAYNITLPADGVVTLTSGANSIAVNTFTSSPTTSGLIGVGGTQALNVGATRAALAANQASGTYSGTFDVTVAY